MYMQDAFYTKANGKLPAGGKIESYIKCGDNIYARHLIVRSVLV